MSGIGWEVCQEDSPFYGVGVGGWWVVGVCMLEHRPRISQTQYEVLCLVEVREQTSCPALNSKRIKGIDGSMTKRRRCFRKNEFVRLLARILPCKQCIEDAMQPVVTSMIGDYHDKGS